MGARGTVTGDEDAQDPERRTVTLHFSVPASARHGCGELQAALTCPAVRLAGQKFPAVVFTSGFATQASQYNELAEALALSGCAVLRYDVAGANEATDETLVAVLRSVLDYASSSEDLGQFVKAGKFVLAGHSRGAKLSSLAAVADERAAGLCLLDPIDNTVWAPLSPGFPSACDALRGLRPSRPLPVAIVGAGAGGDCAPANANYRRFFEAVRRPAWLLAIPSAGHAQFLDREGVSAVQRAVCGSGGADDAAVQAAAAAACLAWVELACGPTSPVGTAGTAALEERSLRGVAARTEVARRISSLSLPGAGARTRELAISVSVAAKTTADELQKLGLEVESFVKV